MEPSETPDDLTLIRETLDGNKESFGLLVEKYKNPIYNLCYRIMNNRPDAEDIAQDAFLRAYSKLKDFKVGFKFLNWLYSIAVNSARDALRKKRRTNFIPLDSSPDADQRSAEGLVPNGAMPPDRTLERKKIKELVFRLVAELPAKYRVPLVFKYFEGWACEDISGLLHMPVGTVKIHLHRARAMLYKKFKKMKLSPESGVY